MSRRGIEYAEGILGVHQIWANLVEITGRLNELVNEVAVTTGNTRRIDWRIERRRQDILIEVSANEGGLNVTQLEKAIKLATAKDELLHQLEEERIEAFAERDLCEAQLAGVRADHTAHSSRLKELGGLLTYYAALKTGSVSAQAAINEASQSPW